MGIYDAYLPKPLNDDYIMKWGKHKDERLGDIPDSYWLWFLEQDWCDKYPKLVAYANLCVEEDGD